MAPEKETDAHFSQADHQAAYVFRPQGTTAAAQASASTERPSKRRRVTKKAPSAPVGEKLPQDVEGPDDEESSSLFVPLMNRLEKPECMRLREKLFHSSWSAIEKRAQSILKDANSATLDQVANFVQTESIPQDRIASAFIITGANIASQDLLFGQLAERLEAGTKSKFVRLRSSEASNVKAALKKIIQDATSHSGGDEDGELALGHGDRKYLNYDLEGLYAHVKANSIQKVFVSFQDSEGFDSALLSDLIVLFESWSPQIPFTLFFGVATSVDLLQARLLKSTCQLLYGAQFDVVQTDTILERIFKPAIAGMDVLLRLGPSFLQGLIDRQHDQVAGIQTFLSSLKYAYMCHFYANPLSIFATEDVALNNELVQSEHLAAFRSLPSFRQTVERAVEDGELKFARSLLQDDDFLRRQISQIPEKRREWALGTLRAVALIKATGISQDHFQQTYLAALSEGILLSQDDSDMMQAVKRLSPAEFVTMLTGVLDTMEKGDQELGIEGWSFKTADGKDLAESLRPKRAEVEELLSQTRTGGQQLKSAYSGQSRVVRTTVVAQKVQLSRDSAALSDEDKALTKAVDDVVDLLIEAVHCEPAAGMFLHETWLYDAKMPYRDVFIPKPRVVFERSLTRPYDYLACSCCDVETNGIPASLPVTSLLYHLYLETPSIINVSDLWAAFYAIVGEEEEEEESAGKQEGTGYDERTALALFYKGLAELKALGFVKQSRKKVDHIAKIKWL